MAQPSDVASDLKQFLDAKEDVLAVYGQYEMLGSATKAMDGATKRLLVPMNNFEVNALATREGSGYRVNMEFFHDKRSLVKTEAKLAPGSPVFVRGPMHVRGQIIIVFGVKR